MSTFASIVGARPQFIKLAPICRAFDSSGETNTHRIVHTGQHYDQSMSDVFFDELEIPKPDIDLNIGSGSHGRQTASMLEALETEFGESSPDVVIVYGDTNSTLAATLAASKMQIPLCHVEAGLRSFNREMPEEINRLVADHCGDRLYAPTPVAMQHLAREGLADRAIQSGDVMLDAVRFNTLLANKKSDVLARFDLEDREYGIVTIHRPVNTTPEALGSLLASLVKIAERDLPLIFPLHPRTRAVLRGTLPPHESGLRIIEPLGYLDMLQALRSARLALTDSGGLQKEAAFVGTSCITLREETEWTETVDIGANVLVGQSVERLETAVHELLRKATPDWQASIGENYGDGNSAERIVGDMLQWHASGHH